MNSFHLSLLDEGEFFSFLMQPSSGVLPLYLIFRWTAILLLYQDLNERTLSSAKSTLFSPFQAS